VARFVEFLLTCQKEKEDAVVLLSSVGGSGRLAYAIYQVLQETKVNLTVIGMGFVASSGAAIFALGDRRILLPGTDFLVHKGRNFLRNAEMQACDYDEQGEMLHRLNAQYAQMFFKTGINAEIIDEHCEHGRDWYLTPEELKKYNVVTEESEGWSKYLQ